MLSTALFLHAIYGFSLATQALAHSSIVRTCRPVAPDGRTLASMLAFLVGAPRRDTFKGWSSMEHSVRYHIENLERRIEQLGAELMNAKEHARLNDLETEIRVANLALEHYREALRLESTLRK